MMLVVMTTAPTAEEAENLARTIIVARLAACVQVLPPMKSFYFWEDGVQEETEHLLLIKTFERQFEELEHFIQTNHSYETPEIVAVEADLVSTGYLAWMEQYLRKK